MLLPRSRRSPRTLKLDMARIAMPPFFKPTATISPSGLMSADRAAPIVSLCTIRCRITTHIYACLCDVLCTYITCGDIRNHSNCFLFRHGSLTICTQYICMCTQTCKCTHARTYSCMHSRMHTKRWRGRPRHREGGRETDRQKRTKLKKKQLLQYSWVIHSLSGVMILCHINTNDMLDDTIPYWWRPMTWPCRPRWQWWTCQRRGALRAPTVRPRHDRMTLGGSPPSSHEPRSTHSPWFPRGSSPAMKTWVRGRKSCSLTCLCYYRWQQWKNGHNKQIIYTDKWIKWTNSHNRTNGQLITAGQMT